MAPRENTTDWDSEEVGEGLFSAAGVADLPGTGERVEDPSSWIVVEGDRGGDGGAGVATTLAGDGDDTEANGSVDTAADGVGGLEVTPPAVDEDDDSQDGSITVTGGNNRSGDKDGGDGKDSVVQEGQEVLEDLQVAGARSSETPGSSHRGGHAAYTNSQRGILYLLVIYGFILPLSMELFRKINKARIPEHDKFVAAGDRLRSLSDIAIVPNSAFAEDTEQKSDEAANDKNSKQLPPRQGQDEEKDGSPPLDDSKGCPGSDGEDTPPATRRIDIGLPENCWFQAQMSFELGECTASYLDEVGSKLSRAFGSFREKLEPVLEDELGQDGPQRDDATPGEDAYGWDDLSSYVWEGVSGLANTFSSNEAQEWAQETVASMVKDASIQVQAGGKSAPKKDESTSAGDDANKDSDTKVDWDSLMEIARRGEEEVREQFKLFSSGLRELLNTNLEFADL